MLFSNTELTQKLATYGIPSYLWQFPDAEFSTAHDDYVPEVWQAWIDSLRQNAPECLTTLDIGGGKTRRVPRWRKDAGDCENHGILCFAHALMGNWISVCRGGPEVGRTVGIAFYNAIPRAENRNRAGGHCVVWAINHAGEFKIFEPGDGEWQQWTPDEYQSAIFGLCA